MNGLAYDELASTEFLTRIMLREFDPSKHPFCQDWHMDENERKIRLKSSETHAYLHIEGGIPKKLDKDVTHTIPKDVYHRMIFGEGCHIISIEECVKNV